MKRLSFLHLDQRAERVIVACQLDSAALRAAAASAPGGLRLRGYHRALSAFGNRESGSDPALTRFGGCSPDLTDP